ncbi:MAG: O-succinylbenzoic acid--CoA ligase [Myxococcota bacterium]
MNSAGGFAYEASEWRVPWLEQRARETPDAPALFFESQRLSYAGLCDRTRELLSELTRFGVAKGDVVSVRLPNCVAMVEFAHCGFSGNLILHLVNARLSAREIEYQLRDCGARFFVHLAGDEAADAVRLDRGVVRLLANVSGARTVLEAAFDPLPGQPKTTAVSRLDLEAPRFVLYTSGTTGKPKGVVLTGENLLASANGSAALLGAAATDRWLLCLPLFHVGGLSILIRSMLAGSAVLLHDGFSPERVSLALDVHGADAVTGISLVASMLTRVLAVRSATKAPPSLACVLLGGGPASATLLADAANAGFPVALTYGLTETASQVATRLPDAPSTAGMQLLPGTKVKIVSDAGIAVAVDVPGEVFVCGGSVMSQYWQNPEATRRALKDGWLNTGDIGALDGDGGLHIFDRRSDLIVSGGENIYPAELEGVLLEHTAVVEVGVAGRPDEVYGARPVAWLVLEAGVEPRVGEFEAHCRARLAGYKCPVKFYAVPALPRTASGKLLRRELGSGGDKALK